MKSPPQKTSPSPPGSPITVQALFPYDAVEHDELSFAAGTVLQVLDSKDSWLLGVNTSNGSKGWFPESYVGPASPTAARDPVARRARVEYDYTAQKPGELNLTTGETIDVTQTDFGVFGWYKGQSSSGENGMFPSNHVRLLDDASTSIEEKHRKLASYGVRIGVGMGAMFPAGALKKTTADAIAPPSHTITSTSPSAPRRQPPNPHSPSSSRKLPVPDQPQKLPAGVHSPDQPPKLPAGVHSPDQPPKLPAGVRSPDHPPKLPTGVHSPDMQVSNEDQPSVLSSLTKSRPTPRKRPPSSVRGLVSESATLPPHPPEPVEPASPVDAPSTRITRVSSAIANLQATLGKTAPARAPPPRPSAASPPLPKTAPRRSSSPSPYVPQSPDLQEDVPSLQTLYDMVSALKIEVAEVRSLVEDERAARVAMEERFKAHT